MQQITTAPAMTQRLAKAGMEKALAQAVAQTIAQAVAESGNGQTAEGLAVSSEERQTLKALFRLEEQGNLRFESLKTAVDALQAGNVTLQVDVAALNDRGDKLEAKVDKLEAKVDKLEAKVDKLETKVDKLETKVDNLQMAVANVEGAVASLQSDVADIKLELAKRGGDNKVLMGLICAIAAGVFVVYMAEKLF